METREILQALRAERGLSQSQLAEKVHVTRQAVSRWETGETLPGPETLKLLSDLFQVSINTLLGSPRQLTCQCCGMPLEDNILSREPDGSLNQDYCKWCYAGGAFAYSSLEELTGFLVERMAGEGWPAQEARAYFEELLPRLSHWGKEQRGEGPGDRAAPEAPGKNRG